MLLRDRSALQTAVHSGAVTTEHITCPPYYTEYSGTSRVFVHYYMHGVTVGSPPSLPFSILQERYFIRQIASPQSQIVLPDGRYVVLAAMPLSLQPVSMRCSSVSGTLLSPLGLMEELLTFDWRQTSRLTEHFACCVCEVL
jgi:hypothetical protein